MWAMSWRGYIFTLTVAMAAVLLYQMLFNPDKSALLDWWYTAWKLP
jgi:hypothetical protein